ncbi:MAG: hypothetical protein U0263_42045 [Polyangiaceae bacterium]
MSAVPAQSADRGAHEDGLQFRLRIQRALDLLNVAVAEVQHRGSVPSGNLRVTAPSIAIR